MKMKLILACDINGGIGYQNRLPWDKLQGDLPRFKRLTDGKTVIMGRNTWDSLPKKPLPGRLNIVVSSRPLEADYDNVIRAPDLSNWSIPADVEFWLIGGASLVNSHWDYVDEIHLSKTHVQYDCDTFIDLLYIDQNFVCEFSENLTDHTYSIWRRK